jgi:hypothetical protein
MGVRTAKREGAPVKRALACDVHEELIKRKSCFYLDAGARWSEACACGLILINFER